MINRFKVLGIVAVLMLLFTACGSEKSDKLCVVTSNFPEYDFVRQIAGDKVDNILLVPVGSELHNYEPTPDDIMKILTCDVFVYVGGESDSWIDGILKNADNEKMKTIRLLDIIESEHSDHSPEVDEHVWTSPVNSIKIVETISETICELDSENSDFYLANTNDYIKVLRALDHEFQSLVSNSERNLMVFADRYPLKHFSDEYDLEYISAFPGCAHETEADAKTVTSLIETVNNDKIPIIFYTEMSNQKMADTICDSTNAEKRQFNTCHNVTKEEFEQGITYSDLMKHNLEVLKEALN